MAASDRTRSARSPLHTPVTAALEAIASWTAMLPKAPEAPTTSTCRPGPRWAVVAQRSHGDERRIRQDHGLVEGQLWRLRAIRARAATAAAVDDVAPPRRLPRQACRPLLGIAASGAGGHVGGEDVVGAPVEIVAGSVVAHGRARVCGRAAIWTSRKPPPASSIVVSTCDGVPAYARWVRESDGHAPARAIDSARRSHQPLRACSSREHGA